MSRILIAVTHLLGAGHLTRAAALARAFAGAGHTVTLVSGGLPAVLPGLDGIRLVPLPPVRITGTAFTALLDPEGAPVTAERLAARRDALLAAFAEAGPDAVVTELYPFGRRVLAPEFEALVEAVRRASPRPLLLASIRDILATPSRPERIAATHARLDAYDGVLVHGDPAFLPLDASWPVDGEVARRLRYTGYVDEAGAAPAPDGPRAGIVVSGGSSAAGLPLQEAAVAAAALTPGLSWRILVGRAVPEPAFAGLAAAAPTNAVVERARPDFRALLARAALSVSQAGYNTVLDLLHGGCPALLVPFEAGHETEQRLRAETLAAHGLARVLAESELTAERLAEAVLAAPPPGADHAIARDGARRSVAIVEEMLRGANRGGRTPSSQDAAPAAPLPAGGERAAAHTSGQRRARRARVRGGSGEVSSGDTPSPLRRLRQRSPPLSISRPSSTPSPAPGRKAAPPPSGGATTTRSPTPPPSTACSPWRPGPAGRWPSRQCRPGPNRRWRRASPTNRASTSSSTASPTPTTRPPRPRRRSSARIAPSRSYRPMPQRPWPSRKAASVPACCRCWCRPGTASPPTCPRPCRPFPTTASRRPVPCPRCRASPRPMPPSIRSPGAPAAGSPIRRSSSPGPPRR
ncbi:glycosyltransferase family protein [Methylobacterium currus]|uniref:glycosyltransferase family protein n=1 Tax=Methylobacterium currus TaxID=2051553 RepID=UPI001FD62532|nr:glycosyltransferase [Methylobacterium currus]